MITAKYDDNWITFAELASRLDAQAKIKLRYKDLKNQEEFTQKIQKIVVEEKKALERGELDRKFNRLCLDRIQKRTPSLKKHHSEIVRPEDRFCTGQILMKGRRATTGNFTSARQEKKTKPSNSSGVTSLESFSTEHWTLKTLASADQERRHDPGQAFHRRNYSKPGRRTNRFTFKQTPISEAMKERSNAELKSQVGMRKAEQLCERIEQLRLKREKFRFHNIESQRTDRS